MNRNTPDKNGFVEEFQDNTIDNHNIDASPYTTVFQFLIDFP